MRRLLALVVLAAPAVARADIAAPPASDGEVSTLELEDASASPCDDAAAELDPQHEAQPPLACTRARRLRVAKLGTVELLRVTGGLYDGFALVLAVHRPGGTLAAPILFAHGGCGAGTCREDDLRSARLVRLDPKGDPAFGLEVEFEVDVTHTSRDLGAPYVQRDHYRAACAWRAGVLDCKQVVLGDGCRMNGWTGTRVRYACTAQTELVPPRLADAPRIPQADLEAVEQLMSDLRREIWDNRDDCARMATRIGAVLDHDVDAAAIARSLNTPPSKIPARFARDLQHAFDPLTGAHTCFADKGVQAALHQLSRALGFRTAP